MEFQKNLLEYISHSLMTADETISIAESVTSGCLQLAFSQMPNASCFITEELRPILYPKK
jgi:nicotinamide mononucleotide (NMN) deamidase PncC